MFKNKKDLDYVDILEKQIKEHIDMNSKLYKEGINNRNEISRLKEENGVLHAAADKSMSNSASSLSTLGHATKKLKTQE